MIDKSTNLGANGYGLDVTFTGTGAKLRLRVGAGTVLSTVNLSALNTWTHVAGTWDGGTARLYVNGAERGAGAAANPVANALPLRFGGDSAGGSLLDGHLDEIMIHGRALSAAEIADDATYGRCKSSSCAPSAGDGAPPVAWWTADGVLHDRVGSHHGAEVGDFDFDDGKVAGAFDLRLPGAYLEVPDDDAFDFTAATPFSVEAWVKLAPGPSTRSRRIVDKITAGGTDGWLLDVLDSHGRFIVGDKVVTGGAALLTDTWYHVAGVFDGTSLRVYVDGALEGELAEVPTLATGNSLPVRIGSQQPTLDNHLGGWADEIAIYARARSASELAAATALGAAGYCRGNGCVPPSRGLAGFWPGDGNANDVARQRHGTATGTVAYRAGAVGQGFALDGAGHVTVASTAALEPSALTIEAWLRPATSGGGVIVEKATDGVARGYSFALTPAGQLSFTIGDGTGSPTVITSTGGANGDARVPVGAWSHVAVRYDRATEEVLLYRNGVELGEGLGVTQEMASSGAPLAIGASSAGASRFPGMIDEVVVWGVAIDEPTSSRTSPRRRADLQRVGARRRRVPRRHGVG